tara:strand:- start:66 stop:485 length:420 start_codon:yes stop_codon:yes gene_type:complete
MNEKISWESSLVKKFSSSNHFKLLNQLKSEVMKYPLNRKKNIESKSLNDNKYDKNTHQNINNSQDSTKGSYTFNKNEILPNKSTVSFNNSKNFSIYKHNTEDDSTIQTKEIVPIVDERLNDESTSTMTFKDRLNQVDLK